MAAPWRRWILLLGAVAILLFIFNHWIVSELSNDILRARLLRFQLTCLIFCYNCFMSMINWIYLADTFDQGRADFAKTNGTPSGSLFNVNIRWWEITNWRQYTVKAALWRAFLLLVIVLTLGVYSTFSFFISTQPSPLSMAMFLSLALSIQLFFAQIVVYCVTFFMRLCRFSPVHKYRHSRFTKTLVILYGLCIISTGFYNTFKAPDIKKVKIPIKDLQIDGMTITFISDIHLGPTVGKAGLERVVHMVNYINSDVVIIGGDLVDGTVNDLHEAVEPLEWIRSKHGVYFVTGNHEYYTADVHNWFNKLESLGVVILHNSNIKLHPTGSESICLAGVDDLTADQYRFMDHKMDLDLALESCDADKPVILIAHQPVAAKEAIASKYRTDLVISGHTHGGQMFPLIIGAYLFNPYYAGLYHLGDYRHIYVSMGTIYWGMPVRFGTSMEITHITLVPAK